ncbi:MAG: putative bifunctional diguanylate cyclase/phosphodiesterase [Actinomycetes bacterium]
MTAAVCVAAIVFVLGVAGSTSATPLGLLANACVLIAGGALAVRLASRAPGASFRGLLGGAALLWGCGQLVVGAGAAVGTPALRSAGDALALGAALLAVAGLARLPRSGVVPWQGARLALEALMIGSAATAVLWRGWFSADPTPVLLVEEVGAVLRILADLTVVALALVSAVRDPGPGRVTLTAGLSLWAGGDLAAMNALSQPSGGWPWALAALTPVAATLVCLGALGIRSVVPEPVDAIAQPGAEARARLTVTVVLTALILQYLLTLLDGRGLDVVSIMLFAVVVLAFAVREMVSSRQDASLLTRLAEQAQRDALTGLGNRWALTERLTALSRSDRPVTVLTLDLDGFKGVNGLLGHVVGDRLLTSVARRLTAACPPGTEAFRLGGDEFAVLMDGDRVDPVDLAHRLRRGTREAAASVAGVDRVALSSSVGVASSRSRRYGDDPARALIESASALRLPKQAGRDSVQVYTAELARADRRRATIEQRLARAVDEGAVDVHFQPVIELAGGRLVGVEALARWTDAELGTVAPGEFVEVAESAGLMAQLGTVVLRRALAVASASGATAAGINVAVNVSALQLRAPGFTAMVADVLHAHATPPDRCVLEVTESSFVGERDAAVATLHDLADLGVVLAVDDFGTGYSSLSYLDRLPFHVVKVDRSLTRRLAEPRTTAVAGAVVRLARELGMDVVLEGIETTAQERRARELGAQYGQGWLWSPAVPPEDVPALLGGTPSLPQVLPQALPSPER